MAFIGSDQENLPVLLPVPHGNELQEYGLASAGHAELDRVAIAVPVAVKDIEHADRAVAPVTADQDAVLLTKLHRVEREGTRNAGQQRIAPRLACNLR